MKLIYYEKFYCKIKLILIQVFKLIMALLGLVLLPIANMLGFSSTGVVAGTAAAWFQSTFLGGYIASGSAFAIL